MTSPPDHLSVFADRKRTRDARCKPKDAVIKPLLELVPILEPASFYCLLMPCLNGPELAIMGDRGVPVKNVWAIEGNPEYHAKMKGKLDVNLLPKAMSSYESVIHIQAIMAARSLRFGLIYLDYFSQPHSEHVRVLRYIFEMGMLADTATLILNFGKHRCHERHIAHRNRQLKSVHGVPTKEYVDQVLRSCRGKPLPYGGFAESFYKSKSTEAARPKIYVTSAFSWGWEVKPWTFL